MSAESIQRIREGFFAALDHEDKATALAALQQVFDLFNAGQTDAWLELLDPEVEWRPPERHPEAATHRGGEGVRKYLRDQFEVWERLRVEAEDVHVKGDLLVILVHQRARARGSGIEVDARVAYVCTVRDRRVVRFEIVPERREALKLVGVEP